MTPQRIQLSRKAGFNLQEASKKLNGLPAVNCARPSRWGNPFVIKFDPHTDYSPQTAEEAVKMYRAHVDKGLMRIKIKQELCGKNLACWCPLFRCDKCGDTAGKIDGVMCMNSNASGMKWCRGIVRKQPCHCDVLLAICNE